jgi:hypothetical protein
MPKSDKNQQKRDLEAATVCCSKYTICNAYLTGILNTPTTKCTVRQ